MDPKEINLALYREGMSALARSGIFTFLRDQSRVRIVGAETMNYAEQHIAAANRSVGYMEAVDDIMSFEGRFLGNVVQESPSMDFGGIEALLERGDITKEEADKLKKDFQSGVVSGTKQ